MNESEATALAQTLSETLQPLLPGCLVHVSPSRSLAGGGIYYVGLTFAVGANRAEWQNGIIQNDPAHTILFVRGSEAQAELSRVRQAYTIKKVGIPVIREKRGTLAEVTQALVNYFTKHGPALMDLKQPVTVY